MSFLILLLEFVFKCLCDQLKAFKTDIYAMTGQMCPEGHILNLRFRMERSGLVSCPVGHKVGD